jgi:hypothetical protein
MSNATEQFKHKYYIHPYVKDHTEALYMDELYRRLTTLYLCALGDVSVQHYVLRIRAILKELGL